MDNKSTNALSEVLQWACSPRGGNNFYGRILNGCGRVNISGLHTAGVTITPEGRYLLACDNEWFAEQPRPFQIVVMIHEAGHLALMHIERELRYKRIIIDKKKFRYIHKILNVAMDMAVNDVAVRPFLSEQGSKFEACREKLIFPEDREYPPDLEFETYFSMLMKDLKEHGFDPNNHELHVQMGSGSGSGQGDEEEEDDQQQGGGGSQGEDEQEQEGGGGGDSEGEKEQQEAQGPGKGDGYDPQQDPNLPGWFKGLLQKQLTVHVDWTDAFEDMTDAEVERATDRAAREGKKIMLAAAQQTEKSRGTLPAGMEAIIEGLLEEPTIPWEIVFRGMLKSALSSKLQESTAQPNPMLFHLEDDGVEPYPGFQNDFTFHVDATFDTSGSVSDEEFKKFMGELMGIMRTEKGVSVRMIMYDAAIQHEEMLDPQDEMSDRNAYDRYGYGGTDFTPALKLILGKDTEEDWVKNAERITNERVPKADLVVMFTDGYAPVDVSEGGPIPDYEPPCPLIWALTSGGKSHPAMGNRVLWITE